MRLSISCVSIGTWRTECRKCRYPPLSALPFPRGWSRRTKVAKIHPPPAPERSGRTLPELRVGRSEPGARRSWSATPPGGGRSRLTASWEHSSPRPPTPGRSARRPGSPWRSRAPDIGPRPDAETRMDRADPPVGIPTWRGHTGRRRRSLARRRMPRPLRVSSARLPATTPTTSRTAGPTVKACHAVTGSGPSSRSMFAPWVMIGPSTPYCCALCTALLSAASGTWKWYQGAHRLASKPTAANAANPYPRVLRWSGIASTSSGTPQRSFSWGGRQPTTTGAARV